MTEANDQRQSMPAHEPRFGRTSFVSAVIGGFLNVTTLFTLNFAYFLLILFFLVEVVTIAVLFRIGGRARQAGMGLAITLLSAIAVLVLMLCAVWLRDHWLR